MLRGYGLDPHQPKGQQGPASGTINLDQDWLFGGKFDGVAATSKSHDSHFERITLPHCVAKLSWQNWDAAQWQDVWIYRRHFTLPREVGRLRVFLHFDGVMVGATPTINDHPLPQHLGGYLPFAYEITDWLRPADNVLTVLVDSRWSNVPPEGAPSGARRIDYLTPGGIYRSVRLEVMPPIFISDVFAKPTHVLDPDRRIEVTCSLNASTPLEKPLHIEVECRDGDRVLTRVQETLRIDKAGLTEFRLVLDKLGNVTFWDVDAPHLYDVVTTISLNGQPLHNHHTRIGLREARFELDGFFLNGRRRQLFGLNRHELFPYVGGAMPPRVQRHDAAMLRHELNCNIVRCSHYPQAAAFLDACDELGLMVWEEVPGWGYLGDEKWQALLVRDAQDMIIRDRNHPSIVIWGTRANESANNEALYQKTREMAKTLDGSRPTSGSMTAGSRRNWLHDWHEEVFAYDDYHAAPDGSVGIAEPTPGVPYMLAEAVGQFNYSQRRGFNSQYRPAGDVALQQQQALRHAQAHSKAAANPRICGVIAWCAFDYQSLINSYHSVKYAGIADVFRIPKLGASFYQAQIDPQVRVVIQPNFYWDFGPQTSRGPGHRAAIFSNCQRLELFINGQPHATLHPDVTSYPYLQYPPFLADLDLEGAGHPELRIDGYINDRLALSKSYSSDMKQDQLLLKADDTTLIGDGSDATRLLFKVADKFGAQRALAGGIITFELVGPGVLVGDNPFALADSGGVGALWVKTMPQRSGLIKVKGTHSSLGTKSVEIEVLPHKIL